MGNRMKSWMFVAEIALMQDVLQVLQGLSLFLQKQTTSIIKAKTDLKLMCKHSWH